MAKVGIGVAVKEGAPLPDIKTVEAFKRTLLAAKSVAYIDPKAGGSSGIYFDGLLARLGIADEVRPKAKLKQGGHVADLVASGEAELGVHQISEILPVKGVVLVGPLPAEVLIDAPPGMSFDDELIQMVCDGWADALDRLSCATITDGVPEECRDD